MKDSLLKTWRDMVCSNLLRAVFHKFYLVDSWIFCLSCNIQFTKKERIKKNEPIKKKEWIKKKKRIKKNERSKKKGRIKKKERIQKNERIKKKRIKKIGYIELNKKRIILWLCVIGRNLSRDSQKTKSVDGAVHFIYYLIFYTLHDRCSMKSIYLQVCFIILLLILLNFQEGKILFLLILHSVWNHASLSIVFAAY